MSLSFVLDPPLSPHLREQILAMWADVTNAGGAVGFVPPVRVDDIRATADKTFAGVEAGIDHVLLAVDGNRLVGLLFVMSNRFALKSHWAVLKRVMIAPGYQGHGYGAALMREATAVARKLGLEALQLTVRGGTGTEAFYERLGYRQVGRLPGALRVDAGDDRDEIVLWRNLRDAR